MPSYSEMWATDGRVSRPQPAKREKPVMVDFGGFGFTMDGMAHNISEADLEEILTPHFAPEGYLGDHELIQDPEEWGEG